MTSAPDLDTEATTSRLRVLIRRHAGLLTAAVIALAWVLLALSRPDTTYHLAPVLVAASWGAARRWSSGGPRTRSDGLKAAGGGLAMALVTTAEQWWMGALDGPTIWGSRGPVPETVALAVLGAALGYRFVTRHRPGFLFPA